MVVPLLNSIDTEDIMNCNDLESAYSKLENRVSEVVQKCTTNISPKTKIDQPWYDHELKKLRIKRQRYHNILKRDRTAKNKENYNAIDKAYGKMIFAKKKSYNRSRMENSKIT